MINKREEIARFNYNQALRCISGMSKEKLKALCHPYPTIKDKIDKYGYDGKQLHHILRMNDFIHAYVRGQSYESCLTDFANKDMLIKAKLNEYSLDEALYLAEKYDKETEETMDKFLLKEDVINEKAEEIMKKVKYQCIRRYILEEVSNEKV